MAWETGTAAGHNDLLNKLLTFLSTNADLVAAKQNWSILRNSDLPHSVDGPNYFAFCDYAGYYTAICPYSWPANIPSRYVKIKSVGKLNVPTSGTYGISLRADDQAEFRIDGKLVAAKYSPDLSSNTFENTATIDLSAGLHDIDVRIIAADGPNGISLGWKKPGDSAFSIIPPTNFSGVTSTYGSADYFGPSPNDFAAQMATREVCLRGPGLAQADQIYVNLRTLSSNQGDLYNILARYATGFDDTKRIDAQPGNTGKDVAMLLWNQSIKYWFIANGRRFIVIAKVSTTYASLYGGFILPYGLPSEIPYPIAVGASSAANTRWSDQTENHSSFWNPAGYSQSDVTSLYLRRTDGGVDAFKNIQYTGDPLSWTYPYRYRVEYRTSPGDSYALEPVVLYSSSNGGNVWGELDGAFAISGFNNASENTQVVNGKTYLVVQSGYRTRANDYAAILLE